MSIINSFREWLRPERPPYQWSDQWSDLARYNDEVARGVAHTDEWKIKMEWMQERFNEAHGRNQDGGYKPR